MIHPPLEVAIYSADRSLDNFSRHLVDAFLGKEPTSPAPSAHPRTIINPAMSMEEKDNVLGHEPGSNLSISELCHALKIKLAQTRDSR